MATSCSYTNFKDVVQAVHSQQLNVTEYVVNCDNACSVMFGPGNPDISGLGMMITYMFQVVVTAFFGPLFPLLLYSIGSSTTPRIIRLQKGLCRLRNSVYTTHLFFSTSLLVAAIVRFQQVPSIVEVIFMTRMISLQSHISYILMDSHSLGSGLLEQPLNTPWLFSLRLSSFAHSIATWTLDKSKTVRPVGYEAALVCHHLRGALDISPIFQDVDFLFVLKWTVVAVGCIVFMVLMVGMFRFMSGAPNLMGRFMRRNIPLAVQQNAVQVVRVGLLLTWVLNLIFETINVLKGRSEMKKLSGEQFKDNDWGYGQTTAVMLWAPFMCEVFVETWKILANINDSQDVRHTEALELQILELKAQLSLTTQQALTENGATTTFEDSVDTESQSSSEEVSDEPSSDEERSTHGIIGTTNSHEESGRDYTMSGALQRRTTRNGDGKRFEV